MSENVDEIRGLEVEDESKSDFDDYQQKFYKYRLEFFARGQVEKVKLILDELSELTTEEELCKKAIAEGNYSAVYDILENHKATQHMSIAYDNLDMSDFEYNNEFEKAAGQYFITILWFSFAMQNHPPACADDNEKYIELTRTFTLSFYEPFNEFINQLEQLKVEAFKMYKQNQIKNNIYLTDVLRDSEGRTLNIDKLAEKWEKCLKVYDLSITPEYKKKDGSPNFTKIGKNAGLYGYAHKHHLITRTKEYWNEAVRLSQSAVNMTFPN